jgi:enoyl-CoA hydratase/carnithine racemase
MKPQISYEKRQYIGIITMDNPPLNLGNATTTQQFYEILDQIEKDPDIRAIILTAKGKVFAAGSDMNEMVVALEEGNYVSKKMVNELKVRNRIEHLKMPTIAAMDGSAYGGGFDMALSCDMRIAAPGIVVSLPEITLGSFPGSGSAYRLTRLIGRGRAIEYMLFAKELTAEEAMALGIINAISEGSALALALKWAEKIALRSPVATSAIKGAVSDIFEPDQYWLDSVQLKWSKEILDSGHLAMGIDAFFNKTPLLFK